MRTIRVLIACESSGRVRKAFEERGHFARSVDLLPTEQLSQEVQYRGAYGCINHEEYEAGCEDCEHDEPWCHAHGMYAYECPCLGPTEDEASYADDCEQGARHLAADLFTVEDVESYDLLIAHPTCTRLTNSGVRWLHVPPPGKTLAQMWSDLDVAAAFYCAVRDLPIRCKAIENPVMHKYARDRIRPGYRQVVQPWWFGDPAFKATGFELVNLPPLVPTNRLTPPKAGTPEHVQWSMVHRASPGPDRWKIRSRTFAGVASAMAEQWGAPTQAMRRAS
jgi:hypothetical protein